MKSYDPFYGKKQRPFIEKLQPNPRLKSVVKNAKKPGRKKLKKLPKNSAQNQPRDRAGKFAKVPVDQRGFFGKLRAWKSGEMRKFLMQQKARNRRLEYKHVHGIDLSPRRRKHPRQM